MIRVKGIAEVNSQQKAKMSSSSKVLSNGAKVMEQVSKVVQTKNGLLEIRRGTMTFPKNSATKPHLWASETDWYVTIATWGFPVPKPIGRAEFIEPLTPTKLANLKQPTTPTKTRVNVHYLAVGSKLMNKDGTSKAVITKKRTLYEIRRYHATGRELTSIGRKEWTTLSEWREFLEGTGMQETILVEVDKTGGVWKMDGLEVYDYDETVPPAPKKQRTEDYVPDYRPHPLLLPSPDTQPQLALTPRTPSGLPYPSEFKNLLVEQVKQKIAEDLRKDLDDFVLGWVKKLKID